MTNLEPIIWRAILKAHGQNWTKQLVEQLQEVQAYLEKDPAFFNMFTSLNFSKEKQAELIHKAFDEAVNPLTIEFLTDLVNLNAMKDFDETFIEVEKIYHQYLKDYHNTLAGKVYAAAPLGEEKLGKLETAFANKYGKSVILKEVEDQSVIGGFRVDLNEKTYDNTLATGIRNLEKELRRVEVK